MSRYYREFVVTREYLISLLRAWQQDKITTAHFYETIKWLPGDNTKFLDWESGSKSVTSEIIAYFERLDLDFITQEAIEPAIKFLNTPIGKFNEGSKKWYQFEYSTNIEERIEKLKGKYPYEDIVSTKGIDHNTIVITREYLISLLRAWQQDKITTAQFYETIEIIFGNYTKLLDWENEEEDSVTRDVIADLEMLDMDFIIQEDIEPIIEFLNTPIGKIEEGIKKLGKYKSSINHQERIKNLMDNILI